MADAPARPKYNQKVLVERYTRDKRYFRIHEIFNPSLKHECIAGKFYSPHDYIDLTTAEPDLLRRIEISRAGVPKDRYLKPVTVNQTYGWKTSVPLVPIKKGDCRYYCPRNASISKINVTLKKK